MRSLRCRVKPNEIMKSQREVAEIVWYCTQKGSPWVKVMIRPEVIRFQSQKCHRGHRGHLRSFEVGDLAEGNVAEAGGVLLEEILHQALVALLHDGQEQQDLVD